MLRSQLSQALKDALKAKDSVSVRTLRLILAALKDRDISARGNGSTDGIDDAQLLAMMQSMIKQRNESIRLYEEGGRCELAESERDEIGVIQRFLPPALEGAALDSAITTVITEIGARDIKDMGRTMAELKQRFPGQMDFSKASGKVREALV